MSASMPFVIISTIWRTFEKGKASSNLLFFPSQVHRHKDSGINMVQHNTSPPDLIDPHASVVTSRSLYYC
jgi:hypothetical protein